MVLIAHKDNRKSTQIQANILEIKMVNLWTYMKYLVTGGAGFIGSHVVQKLLQEKHQVVVVDNFDDFYPYQIKAKNILEAVAFEEVFSFSNDKESDLILLEQRTNSNDFQLYNVDITDELQMEKIFITHQLDGIIHLAALAGVRPSIERPLEYEKVNVKGTNILLELAKQFEVKNNLVASSSSVYGNNEKVPFSETDVVDFPISPYASTKKSAEVMSYVYHSLYEMNIMQLRFFTVYGPRQRPDLAIYKFTRLIENNEPIPFYGDGNTARDYTYIEDIIQGVFAAIRYMENHDHVFEIVNLGESEVISLKEMVATLEKHLDKKATLNKLPMQPGDVQMTNADISKAKKLLNYQPSTNFETGIQKFVEWYRENESHA